MIAPLLWKNEQFQARLQKLFSAISHIGAAILLIWVSPLLADRYRGAHGLPLGVTLHAALIAFLMAYLVQFPDSPAGKS
jgi:hypothetical protein